MNAARDPAWTADGHVSEHVAAGVARDRAGSTRSSGRCRWPNSASARSSMTEAEGPCLRRCCAGPRGCARSAAAVPAPRPRRQSWRPRRRARSSRRRSRRPPPSRHPSPRRHPFRPVRACRNGAEARADYAADPRARRSGARRRTPPRSRRPEGLATDSSDFPVKLGGSGNRPAGFTAYLPVAGFGPAVLAIPAASRYQGGKLTADVRRAVALVPGRGSSAGRAPHS